jgi:DMSO/TMAO reductase YedYZ molybdopterin-dependent catalytic subunit
MALPKKDIVFDFKCIEGWSQVTHWAGVSLKTFMDHYHLGDQEKLKYVGLQTPDKKYYVGIDMPSALHPQTLLCYEMNGKPLPMNQGFPLRLIIPVKYGIKHLKRIGTMNFSDEKPADYWAEQGYDYYAGH